jgi:hypothetical protein
MESRRGRGEEMLPEYAVVWLDVLESATQSVTDVGGVNSMVLKEPSRDCGSHPLTTASRTTAGVAKLKEEAGVPEEA